MDKRSIYSRVYFLAKGLDINQTNVAKILSEYTNVCKREALEGNEVRIPGLVNIVPTYKTGCEISTLAYHCNIISNILSIPYFSVLHIIKRYIAYMIEDLENGLVVEVRTLFILTPSFKNNSLVCTYATASNVLKKDYCSIHGDDSKIRVSSNKLYKKMLAQQLEVV